MFGYIDGVDFSTIEPEKYWSFPATFKGNKTEEIRKLIMSDRYYGAEKKDGYYERFVKDEDGNIMIVSRVGTSKSSGKLVNKIGHVPHLHDFFNSLPNGTCFLGEIYFENLPGSKNITTIMGCLEKKAIERQKDEKLSYYIFDIWAWNGKSMLSSPAKERFELVEKLRKTVLVKKYEFVEVAEYKSGYHLFDLMEVVREKDGEGIVITDGSSLPEPGKRTSWKTLKIKKELDNPIDVFLTGNYKTANKDYKGKEIVSWKYWENTRTGDKLEGEYYNDYFRGEAVIPVNKLYFYGWASSIEYACYDPINDKIIPLGWISNIPDSIKADIAENQEKYRNKVILVNAMEADVQAKTFRHAKIEEWREDIPWTDCTLDKVF